MLLIIALCLAMKKESQFHNISLPLFERCVCVCVCVFPMSEMMIMDEDGASGDGNDGGGIDDDGL